MARAVARAKKKNSIEVDFSGVDWKSGGGSFHITEGDYKMKVESVEEGVSKNDNEQLAWIFKGLEGKAKGKTFYFYTTLTPDSLWKLGQTLDALGIEVPDSATEIDLDELVDLECVGVVIDDEYQGKVKSKLQEIRPIDGDEETTEEDGPKAGKKVAGKKGKAKETYSTEEVMAMSEEELNDLNDKHSLEVKLRLHKTLRKKQTAVAEALTENELIED